MSKAVGPNSRHGIATYHAGCRCDSCRDAQTVSGRRRRRKLNLANPGPYECRICPFTFHSFPAVRYHESVEHDL